MSRVFSSYYMSFGSSYLGKGAISCSFFFLIDIKTNTTKTSKSPRNNAPRMVRSSMFFTSPIIRRTSPILNPIRKLTPAAKKLDNCAIGELSKTCLSYLPWIRRNISLVNMRRWYTSISKYVFRNIILVQNTVIFMTFKSTCTYLLKAAMDNIMYKLIVFPSIQNRAASFSIAWFLILAGIFFLS